MIETVTTETESESPALASGESVIPQQPTNMLFNLQVRLLAQEAAHAKLSAKLDSYIKRVGL